MTETTDERRARALAVADGKDPDLPAWVRYPGGETFGICWRDQYLTKARAIAASDEAAGMVLQEWRDIETAPRDGTQVLLSNRTDGYISIGHFVAPCEMDDTFDDDEPDWFTVDGEYLGTLGVSSVAPTHWMPLPPPPIASDTEEK